jgi:hypothetical protein
MSRQDYLGSPAEASGIADPPSASAGLLARQAQPASRRAVLRAAGAAGAAGIAATALSGLGGSAMAASDRSSGAASHEAAADATADSSEQFVVHVKDARAGDIEVFRGSALIRVRDRDLAMLLDRVSRQRVR